MATIKAYTNIEQSRKLAEVLLLESADMSYSFNFNSETHELSTVPYKDWIVPKYAQPDNGFGQVIPCWSLAALLGVLPDSIYDNTNEFSQLEFSKRSIAYRDLNDGIKIGSLKDNLIDACVAMIERLHELKML